MKSFQKIFFAIVILLFLFTNYQKLYSQYKLVDGVSYHESFILNNSHLKVKTNEKLNKTTEFFLSKIKNDYRVSNECGEYGSNQLYPDIAKGENGDFLCVWVDERTGAQEILAQLYNSSGEKEFGLIRVSNNIMSWNVSPHVVFNRKTKEYLISWAASSSIIALQRLDENGNKLNGNIQVNDQNLCNTNNPSIAIDKSGNIMVTWFSNTNSGCSGFFTAFVRQFDKQMNAISDQQSFLDEDSRISSIGRDSRITSDTLGNSVVVWSGFFEGHSRIFLQKINSVQSLFEDNILVSDTLEGIFPTITSTLDGNYLITWSIENTGIAGRIFNADSGFVSEQFFIIKENYYSNSHSSSSDDIGNYYVASSNLNPRIHKLNKFGEIIDSVNITSTPIKYPILPKLSKVTNGEFYNISYGNNNGDIDVQIDKYYSSLIFSGKSLLIEDDCSSPEKNPKVKFNKDGNSIIVWEGKKDGYRSIYGQTFDENFNPTSEEILISDSSKYFAPYRPKISTDNSGNYLITFAEKNSSYNNVFQKISYSGKKIANNLELSKHYESPYIFNNIDKNNNTLFCWSSGGRNWNNKVYFQQFDTNMNPHNEARILFTGDRKKNISVKDIWIDTNLNSLILWNGYNIKNETYDTDLKAILFNKEGKVISDTMLVNFGKENTKYGSGKCMKNENGDYIFVWMQWNSDGYNPRLVVSRNYIDNCKIYIDSLNLNSYWTDFKIIKFSNKKSFITYKYSDSIQGSFIDDSQRKIVNVTLNNLNMTNSNSINTSNNYSCDIYNDKLLFTYEFVKEENRSYDIWANVQNFSDIYTEIKSVTSKTEEDEIIIYNPYPNPVLSFFTLQYDLQEFACVKLAIYNSIGQVVKKIDFGVLNSGQHSTDIDVSNFSSGVYFIKGLNTKTNIKKFIVLK